MFDLKNVDLDLLVTALSDRDADDHPYLIDPDTGEITRSAGETKTGRRKAAEAHLVMVEPVDTWMWHADMSDFGNNVSNSAAAYRLGRAAQRKGSFRRFREDIDEKFPELLPAWLEFRDNRARRHAVDWLADNELIKDEEAARYRRTHPDPKLP